MPVIHAVVFTAVSVLCLLAVGVVLSRSPGQHAGAGDGALSVAQLQAEIAREARARVGGGRHRLRERGVPSPWTEPTAAMAA